MEPGKGHLRSFPAQRPRRIAQHPCICTPPSLSFPSPSIPFFFFGPSFPGSRLSVRSTSYLPSPGAPTFGSDQPVTKLTRQAHSLVPSFFLQDNPISIAFRSTILIHTTHTTRTSHTHPSFLSHTPISCLPLHSIHKLPFPSQSGPSHHRQVPTPTKHKRKAPKHPPQLSVHPPRPVHLSLVVAIVC
ncbi:uncharacterized protein BDZ83DRAFT_297189 [Colletotrichum acutatum]|uniref:Uncharacterized protein n=1 Tax=Glomerella acutata TaxID=27357 RepID=A0AAD8XPF3_GLOAC|nr:uncharacterized protein BDZ83DRAFT_297189 [Colletotrichum acutatum]KAK1731104.1 hypothetical protein BDZ83DRAFT_297189 [Colletotrichum acutatum]